MVGPFALTGGILCRRRHCMAFWRDPAHNWYQWVITVPALRVSPSLLIYVPEANIPAPDPIILVPAA